MDEPRGCSPLGMVPHLSQIPGVSQSQSRVRQMAFVWVPADAVSIVRMAGESAGGTGTHED